MPRFSPKLPANVRRLFRLPATRERLLRELDDEMRAHVAMRVDHLRALGMTEPEARAEAMRRFGDFDEFRGYAVRRADARARGLRMLQWLLELGQDARFAARQFARTPVFTTVAVATLALGIGANTAIFSVVYTLLLAPLPYPNGGRVVIPVTHGESEPVPLDRKRLDEWRNASRSIEMVAGAAQAGMFDVHADGTITPNPNAWMTANYLDALGVRPVLGRPFTSAEEKPNASPVAMISEGLWRREYAGSASAIGATIRINDRLHTIVGVAPADLSIPLTVAPPPDIWLPKELGNGFVFALLREGVSAEAASRELQATAAVKEGSPPVRVMHVQEFLDSRQVRSVQVLFVAVGVLLLIACANVANLLLARAWTRRRELAVRRALGAGRGRLARQILAESTLLALVAAIAGIGVAWAALRTIIALRPPGLEHLASARIDGTVMMWSVGVSLLTGLVFGCLPALFASASTVGDILRNENRTGTPGVLARRVRSSLIVAEVALSLVLLVGAGLLARTFLELQRIRLGFEPRGLVAVSALTGSPPNGGGQSRVRSAFIDRVRSTPGVIDVAVGAMPGSNFGPSLELEASPDASAQPARASNVAMSLISEDYFRVARLALVEGRAPDPAAATADFKAGKDWGPSSEVVLSRALARRLWPNGGAVGSYVRQVSGDGGKPGEERRFRVVGVADDVRTPGARADLGSLVIYSLLPPTFPMAGFVVRTATPGEAAVPALRQAAAGVDARFFAHAFRSGELHVRDGLASARFAMALLAAFAVIACVMAAVGLYGVVSYGVHQRTREIGLRVALGASPSDVARLVVGGGVRLGLIGVVLGTAIAAGSAPVLRGLLYGIAPTDPLTFVAIAAVVAATAVLASYLPARRALRIDPTEALRAD